MIHCMQSDLKKSISNVLINDRNVKFGEHVCLQIDIDIYAWKRILHWICLNNVERKETKYM